jgi:hypothetical protein
MADVNKEIALKVVATDATGPALQSLEDKLNAAKKRMVELAAAGKQNTEEFQRLQVEAGNYKRTIEGVEQSVDSFAKGGSKAFTLIVEASQAVAAGFAIAQGAAALFGDENEDLQKAMVQVQGAMALVNGVQQINILLTQKSVITTEAAAAAQRVYAIAVGTSTGALRAFRVALLASGVGIVVAGLGLLIAKWDELTAAVRRYLNLPDPKQRAMEEAQALMRQEATLENYRDAYEKHTNDLIANDAKRKAAAEEATKTRLEKLKEENNAIIKFVEDLNLTLYEMRLDDQAAQEQAIIDGMRKEGQARASAAARTIQIEDAKAEEIKRIEQSVADFKQQVTFDSLTAISQTLSAFGNENKGLAIAALAIEKGSAIANVIINLQKEMSANAAMAFANPANALTGGAVGIAQTKALNTMAKIRAGLRIAAITAAGIQAGKTIMGGGESGGAPSPAGPMPMGAGGAAAPPIFANPNTTDLSAFGNSQGQGMQPMRAYVVERDIQQTTSRVRRLSEFATLG